MSTTVHTKLSATHDKMTHILYNEKSQNLPTENDLQWSILVDLLRNRPDRILSASFGIPKLPDRNVVSGRSYQHIFSKNHQ